MDIDEALAVQPPLEEGESVSKTRSYNQSDKTFGFYETKDGHLGMGNKVVGSKGNTIFVEGSMYLLTPGLNALITYRRPLHE